MKFSFLIASNKSSTALNSTIKSIKKLKDDDLEILVCSKDKIEESHNVKWVKDDRNTGSVYAFNKAYSESQNKYIVIIPDDHHVTNDFLKINNYLESDEFRVLKFKICNLTFQMGGPEKIYYDKKQKKHSGDLWPKKYNPLLQVKNARPYNIFHFFAIERSSVEKYMENVIFNTSFRHHYVDHWLGFYEEIINGNRPTEKLGPEIYLEKEPKFDLNPILTRNEAFEKIIFDEFDKIIFKKLVSISNRSDITYNFQV